LIFKDFFVFGRKPHHKAVAAEKKRHKQPFFEKFLDFSRNKQPFLKSFLFFSRNKQAFSKSPHVMSEVPL